MESHRYKTEWNKDTVYALGLFKQVTNILGLWPTKNRKLSGIKISIVIFVQILSVSIVIKYLLDYGNCGNPVELVDALTLITSSSLTIVKVLLPWLQVDQLNHIVSSAVEDWCHVSDKSARKLMLKYAKIGRIVLIVLFSGNYMAVFPLIIARPPGYINVQNKFKNETLLLRNLPIGPTCWTSEMSQSFYFIYYIFLFVQLLILGSANFTADAFIFGLAQHVCGQFELLYKSVGTIRGDENYCEQRIIIRRFVQRHQHLLQLANRFEAVSNWIIFFEVAAYTFVICISGITLIWAIKVGDGDAILAMIIRPFVMYVQLFLYSSIGEDLSNQTEKLQVAVYNSPWFKLDKEIVRDMSFIMMRNNYPFNLTVGKIYSMNISHFKDLVKSMFSYFSILRLMFED